MLHDQQPALTECSVVRLACAADDIEKHLFGAIDRDGPEAVEYMTDYRMSGEAGRVLKNLLVYMDAQVLRTPRGQFKSTGVAPSTAARGLLLFLPSRLPASLDPLRSRHHARRPTRSNDDGIVRRCASDLPEVAFRVHEVGIAAHEELGIDWVLSELPACLPDAFRQLVDLLRFVDAYDDAEPNPAATQLWLGVAIGSELLDGEQRQEHPSQLEDRKVVRVECQRPAQAPVEVPLRAEVLNAKGDRVRQRERSSIHLWIPPENGVKGPDCG